MVNEIKRKKEEPKELKVRKEVSKSNLIMMANLDEKLNEVEMKVFTYGLYRLKKAENKLISRFSIKELEEICNVRVVDDTKKHITLQKPELTRYLKKVRKTGFTVFNEEFYLSENFTNNGRWVSQSLLKKAEIIGNEVVIEWINDEETKQLLTGITEQSLILDLDVIAKFSDKGILLYEILKSLEERNTFQYKMSLEEVAILFKPKGKSRTRYNYLKEKFIQPAVNEINNNTTMDITFDVWKEGRNTRGFDFSWRKDEKILLVSEKQYKKINEIKQDFAGIPLEYQDEKYNSLLKHINKVDEDTLRNDIKVLIADAISFNHSVKEQIKLSKQELLQLEDTLPYQKYIELWKGNVTLAQKDEFTTLVNKFPESIQQEVAEIAITESINGSTTGSFIYCLNKLKDWYAKQLFTIEQIKLNEEESAKYKTEKNREKTENDVVVSEDFLSAMNLWAD